jgi:DNA-binding CsgD family transcriptional regulator
MTSATNQDVGLSRIWTERSTVSRCVLNVIGCLQCGGFLLGHDRQVLFLNKIASYCLGDGLTVRGKSLAAMDRESDVRLQSLIGLALHSPQRPNELPSAVVRRGSRLPLVVRILRLEENAQPALNSARLLLVSHDPENCQVPPPDMLTDMYGLTPAEASVAIGIVGGKHLAEIAADRGVKIGTVRAHSKSVFAKTRTRGQAELAALVIRMAFLIPPRAEDASIARAGAR